RLSLLQWLSRLRARCCMWQLRKLLAPDFDEFDFLAGARQAATTIIRAVQQADWSRIRGCCTDQGACAIYGLTQSQRQINYSKLVRFENQHLCQVSPVSVRRQREQERQFVYVNVALVGLRDMRDFATPHEQQEMQQLTRQVLLESEIPERIAPCQRRLVVGEFLLTLRRELGELEPHEWLIDFYKVFGFKLVNYSPVTLQYRIIELLKPV
ncbi:hypothetical protein KR222_008475, partial [Zaprionus bogoriensis]